MPSSPIVLRLVLSSFLLAATIIGIIELRGKAEEAEAANAQRDLDEMVASWKKRDAHRAALEAEQVKRASSVEALHEAGAIEELAARGHDWTPAPDHARLFGDLTVGRGTRNPIVGLGLISREIIAADGLDYGCYGRGGSELDRMDEYGISIQVRYHVQGKRQGGECPEGTTFFMETARYRKGVGPATAAEGRSH